GGGAATCRRPAGAPSGSRSSDELCWKTRARATAGAAATGPDGGLAAGAAACSWIANKVGSREIQSGTAATGPVQREIRCGEDRKRALRNGFLGRFRLRADLRARVGGNEQYPAPYSARGRESARPSLRR